MFLDPYWSLAQAKKLLASKVLAELLLLIKADEDPDFRRDHDQVVAISLLLSIVEFTAGRVARTRLAMFFVDYPSKVFPPGWETKVDLT